MSEFLDVIKKNISKNKNKKLYTYYEGYTVVDSVTYGEFDTRMRSFGGYLQSMDSRGERAVILLPSGIDYLVAYFACLITQTISIPMYVVDEQIKADVVAQVIKDSGAKYIITSKKYQSNLEKWFRNLIEDLVICYVDDFFSLPLNEETISDEQVAYLQYTSGSTSQSKGVKITYGNIYYNCLVMKKHFNFNEKDIFTAWLPLYFDMGLIGVAINTIFNSSSNYFTSTEEFMKHPISWLNAINLYRGTVLIAPNFAYEMCANIIPKQMVGIDLSSVRLTINGSELVRHRTLHSLAEKLQHYNLRSETFNPAYGLAENTLIVSAHYPEKGYEYVTIDGEKLRNNIIKFCDDGLDIVSCGKICEGVELKIVSLDTGDVISENQIGEIWLSGPSVANGYWSENTGEEFNRTLPDEDKLYFSTGDLGFLHNGFLYIVGRKKDMIIMRGKNFYSQDIENIVLKGTDEKLKNVVAFAMDIDDKEALIIMAELNNNVASNSEKMIMNEIKNIIVTNYKIVPHNVVLCPPNSLPRTNSGKVRRQSCQKLYLEKERRM